MRIAAAAGRTPSADPAVLAMLIDDVGPWLGAGYTAVHGEKAPRRSPLAAGSRSAGSPRRKPRDGALVQLAGAGAG